MKRFIVLAIACPLALYLVAGCAREAKIYYDPEEMISVRVKQEFIIATESNPPTGYMWRETYNESMLELTASTFEISEAVKRGEAEIGLEQHFQFKALKKGKTEILIDLAGPDLKSVKKRKAFSVSIE